MIESELTGPHHVTAGFTGQPGSRTFHLQAEDETVRFTVVLEKQQVAAIADLLGQLLARLDDTPASDWDRAAMALREPLEVRWRAGAIQVGLDPDSESFVLELEELTTRDVEDPRELRIWLTRDQARRLAAHAAEIVTQGRPPCPLCGRPLLAEGRHVCPATNGHGSLTR